MNFQQTWSSKKANHAPMNNGSSWQAKNKKGFAIGRIIFNKTFFKIIVVMFLLGVISLFALFAWFSRDLPNPNQLMDRQVAQSTKIYDRTGTKFIIRNPWRPGPNFGAAGRTFPTTLNGRQLPWKIKIFMSITVSVCGNFPHRLY